MKILIAEDDEQLSALLERTLSSAWPQAEVVTAKDGFEAGVRTAELRPDAIILDINLPGLDGYWVCRALRTRAILRDIRILAVSGEDVPALRDRILGAGADDFLAKPFAMEELVRRLKALLDAPRAEQKSWAPL